MLLRFLFFFFSSRRRHTRYWRDWSSDVCSSDLHVRLLAELVTDRETTLGMPVGHTRFLALIESPAALPHLFAIAGEPRMAGMSVGGEDMATELGAIPSADSMYVFAMQGLAAARPAGILPMGSMGQLAKMDDLYSYRA